MANSKHHASLPSPSRSVSVRVEARIARAPQAECELQSTHMRVDGEVLACVRASVDIVGSGGPRRTESGADSMAAVARNMAAVAGNLAAATDTAAERRRAAGQQRVVERW